MKKEFILETTLRDKDPDLHQRVKDSVFALENMLNAFLVRFPTFTDHSILHSLDVMKFCNMIVGEELADKLSPEEIYVIIMAAYLHDIGMGINDKDYQEFTEELAFREFFRLDEQSGDADRVRAFHNEYSGLFIEKYADLFDIPSKDLVFAIIQASRGHRKTDLYDEKEYPIMKTERGEIRTPYLAALIRLADEIDVASERNPELLFDSSDYTDRSAVIAFGSHDSIKEVDLTDDEIVLRTRPISEEFIPIIEELAEKIQETLDYCIDVSEKRCGIEIRQKKVRVEYI